MKTIVTLFLFIPVFMFAQIPNNSFENWVVGNTEYPVQWITNNNPSYISIFKVYESYSGSFAAKVVSNGPSFEGAAPGWLKTSFIPATIPTQLTLYYKCDSILSPAYGAITINQYINGINTEIGKAEILSKTQSFTLLAISLNCSQIPDSIDIKISSVTVNNGIVYEGYISIIVDDIVFSNTTGFIDPSLKEILKLFPNPVNGYLNLEVSEDFDIQNGIIQIIDLNGKLLKNMTLNKCTQEVYIGDLSSNTYLLKVMNHKRSAISRFVVQ